PAESISAGAGSGKAGAGERQENSGNLPFDGPLGEGPGRSDRSRSVVSSGRAPRRDTLGSERGPWHRLRRLPVSPGPGRAGAGAAGARARAPSGCRQGPPRGRLRAAFTGPASRRGGSPATGRGAGPTVRALPLVVGEGTAASGQTGGRRRATASGFAHR